VLWIIIRKLICQSTGLPFRAVTDQPLFQLSIAMLIIGMMMFCTGFICEMISRNAGGRNDYNIRERF